ncbi:NUDIX hydrolase [Dyadobacter chenwenxiniae]|uniref:NUDIX hydrolase n=1 Tax=Dyadobacter chenwenxiniae TaxID=2906456 RepID=A0A9X1PQ43_9BACT|nr:NUDIX hydrolase [Dyadobacter chenwenxiniae]MCF0050085.1 NUDIX hydrolase [Dyadobacter chenwenxiniae]MCF0064876.1 NUDIX hydrolase [Dyadobacter chenwenxiniae]UON82998.1 NUDIX hydrolase [Dyadobacter chenwenxiniae]
MISLAIDGALFNYRVAGVAIVDGKVLLHKTPSDKFWSLPGGRASLFEFSKDTLIREMQEETGMDVEVGEMLWISENFFVYNDIKHHELGFYYQMEIPSLKDQNDFIGVEGDGELFFKWHSVAEISQIKLYPEFLAAELAQNPLRVKQFSSGFINLDQA